MIKSPWFLIWVCPKMAIQRVVEENPRRSLWLLAAVYGFASLLNLFQSISLGNAFNVLPILFLAAILSPFWGYAIFSIWSGVILWTGKWLKGKGDFLQVRAAYAWSCVPLFATLVLWLVLATLFGRQLFLHFPEKGLSDQQVVALFLILIAKVVFAAWSLIIYLNALAQVQQFSILRSIGNVLLSAILLSAIFAALWWIFLSLVGSGGSQAALYFWHEGGTLEILTEKL